MLIDDNLEFSSFDEFITKLKQIIRDNFNDKQAKLLDKFSEYYYRFTALEDLQKRNIEDLYGALLSHWNFIASHDSDKSYVKVYNPTYNKNGWKSNHTVIEVVHPDLPFVVDSISRAITRLDLTSHLMITPGSIKVTKNTKDTKDIKDNKNNIININLPEYNKNATPDYECLVYIEVDMQDDTSKLRKIEGYLQEVLSDIRIVVQDWDKMRVQADNIITELRNLKNYYSSNKIDKTDKIVETDEITEAADFINWLINDHFTFIGCCDYIFVEDESTKNKTLQLVEQSGYGILSKASRFSINECFKGLPRNTLSLTTYDDIIVMTKSSMMSTVHRNCYLDYLAVKIYGPDNKVLGERRFLGLYTATAYNSSIKDIPFLRRKIKNIYKKAKISFNTHAGKNLSNILETLPRDDLFQAQEEEIYRIAINIMHMQERKQIRLFARKDIYNRFYSCLVYIPKDIFNSNIRQKVGDILLEGLGGTELNYSTFFSESILTRVDFIIRLPIEKANKAQKNININSKLNLDEISLYKNLEKKIIDCCSSWNDSLQNALIEEVGEYKAGFLFQRYANAFSASYTELYSARKAVYDILKIENIIESHSIALSLYKPLEEEQDKVRLKLFNYKVQLSLSKILPILENMGMQVISENSSYVKVKSDLNKVESCYINDFIMEYKNGSLLSVDIVHDNFKEAFINVWHGHAENDKFNQLVITCNFSWRDVAILRAYSKYFRQIGFTFSENYIQETVLSNLDIVKDLISLFKSRFCLKNHNKDKQEHITNNILEKLDQITNLDEDRILRRFLDVILATLRTNFFQVDKNNNHKHYISFKFDPTKIPNLVLPLPMYEIFVYSPRIEGVHLRGGKVARGGLRWSDRMEDFRTEVLGLMKAQQVKNAVIVPAGAKGGFVCKKLPEANKDKILKEVINCYSIFIKGLLDLTDNIIDDKVVAPPNLIRHDDDDTYLVVAADKGTATFSDIANEISDKYNFWLGDAFASGGSLGYDHKKMGITAKGAWESVKRHFSNLNIDITTNDFTVVGIGDMAGDVFGNGMLLSEHIKLVAAFNHMHIFLDPNPNAKESFKERMRLFNLPRSSWQDYDSKLISKGGGIYSRHVKAIKLSKEIKEVLGIKKDVHSLIPNDLIKYILKAPVDLLWNGGIGTYIKAESETDDQVGDRSNDQVRINGKQLNCKIVGEGGNLGCTQLGRVEAALNSTAIFTDFIDNSAGVDCSDHEVNIKILLNSIIKDGDLTLKHRNQILESMTENIANLVLSNNYNQSYAISLAVSRSEKTLQEHAKFIRELEREGLLNRELEFLPSDDQILERKAHNKGLTSPEIATLVAYSKIILKQEILNSDLTNDPELLFALKSAFPKQLIDKYYSQLQNHRLKKEIIATQLSNEIVNSMGFTYIKRLFDETGANTADIVKAHMIAENIFDKNLIMFEIVKYNGKVDAELLNKILFDYIRLIRRTARWLLRNHRTSLDIKKHISYYKPLVHKLWNIYPDIISGDEQEAIEQRKEKYIKAGIDAGFASKLSYIKLLYSSMDILYISCNNNLDINKVATLYYLLSNRLELSWFREHISLHPVDDNWDALARAASRDDVDLYQREITLVIISSTMLPDDLNDKLDKWQEVCKSLITRWQQMVLELKATKSKEFTIFSVALRELLDLAQLTQYFLYKN